MCLRELLVALDNSAMVKIIIDGCPAYTGPADRAPLTMAHRYAVAKIYSRMPHITIVAVEEE